MADFWSGLGNWLGDITGYNQAQTAADQRNKAAANQEAGAKTMASAASNAGNIANKSATQFAGEAGAAGTALGNQMGQQASDVGTQKAIQAARTAGLNKGQAAIMGSGQAGQNYVGGQQTGQLAGMNAYGQGANTQLNATGVQGAVGANQAGLGTNQITGSTNQSAQGNQATGGLLSAIGGLFSDKKQKEDVKAAPDVMAILAKLDPVRFKYKPEAEEGSGEHVGVMAQDIEKTPMKENVVDTPEGKMVDTRKQEMSNLDLIVQLASKIKELEGKVGAKNA